MLVLRRATGDNIMEDVQVSLLRRIICRAMARLAWGSFHGLPLIVQLFAAADAQHHFGQSTPEMHL